MAQTQVKYESGFEVVECAHCSLPFGLTTHFMKQRREDHQGFQCPNGHD